MKANKPLLIVQLSLMYAGMISLFLMIIFYSTQVEPNEILARTLVILGITCHVLASCLAVPIFILSFISIFKKDIVDQTFYIMAHKIIAIPWFIANFVYVVLISMAMLNPFLLLAIPVWIAISVVFTFVNMFTSSFVNFAYVMNSFKNKRLKPNGLLITGLVFQFIFCLDFLGAIFIYIQNKKQKNADVMEIK